MNFRALKTAASAALALGLLAPAVATAQLPCDGKPTRIIAAYGGGGETTIRLAPTS